VVHAHPKIAALDNSSKYTAGFVSSIEPAENIVDESRFSEWNSLVPT